MVFALEGRYAHNRDNIWSVIKWSLDALATGLHPSTGPGGEDLCDQRAAIAGTEIAGGFKFLLAYIVGDMEWVQHTYEFDTGYNKDHLCWTCLGTKSISGGCCGYDFHWGAAWEATCVPHSDYWGRTGWALPACSLPGWHLYAIRYDIMHVLLLGLAQWAFGCTMKKLLGDNYFEGPTGGPWQQRYGQQLKKAYGLFIHWCRERKIIHSQRAFTLGRLSLKKLAGLAYFKAKAKNTLVTLQWICALAATIASDHPSDENSMRASCLWGFVYAIDVLRDADFFLTDADCAEIERARESSLHCHTWLVHNCVSWFPNKPKCHAWDKLLRICQAERVNPLHWWCFADEDFIGKVLRIGRGLHPRTRPTGIMQRYLVLLHGVAADPATSIYFGKDARKPH